MKRLVIFIFTVALLFISCGDKNVPKQPDNLIPRDKMQNIIYDLYVVTSAKGINKKILEDNGVVPEAYILNKYNIDSIQFVESNNFYAYDSEGYKTMIESIKTKLESQKKHFEELQNKEALEKKRKRDSTYKANRKKKKDTITNVKKLPSIN